MKPNKWMIPLVAVSVLVISGCSQMQQSATNDNATNRLTTGSGSSLSGNTLSGASGLAGRSTSSFGGVSSNGLGDSGSSSTTGLGGSLVGGGSNSSSFGTDNRLGGSGDYKVTDLNDPNSILSRRVIYFAYDQSTIEPEYFEILDAHSELLAGNPNLTIRLEGHADERGSREYNVALSERRAGSVKQFMDLKGVGSEQSQTVAYGEELPVDSGHNEAAWSKNRRVEIKYIGR